MAELAAGSVVAGCRVEAVVGRGGMGVVYRATQLSLERPVALKAIAPELAGDPTFRERFKRESRIAASIEHPNVIPVYEAGEGDGLLYLIMRYVEGTDLRALIDAEGALPPERAVRIVAQVAAALAAAHRRDLIHRDVKPANVLIDSDGERDHAYLTDFGIARHAAATSGLTRTGSVIGTLDYLAPERIQDEGGDGRSDVYALGCVLFEALTGALPFERENDVAKMYAHLNAPVPSVRELEPSLPESLDALVGRAMAKDPADRFSSASEFAETLTDELPARAPRAPEAEAAEEPTAEALPPTEPVLPDGISEEIALEAETGEELSLAERHAEPEPAEDATADASAPAAPSRNRGVLLAAAGAGVAAVAVVLVLSLSGGDPSGDGSPSADTSARGTQTTEEPEPEPAPLAFRPAGAVSVAPGADGLAAAGGTAWAANKDTGQVIPIDEVSAEPGEPIGVGANPDSVAVGFGSVWVTNTDDDSVSQIDPESGAVERTIDVGRGPEGIAVSDDAVWVANGQGGSVTRIPADGSDPLPPERVGTAPVQIAVTDDDRIWVTISKGDAVVELDPTSGTPIGDSAVVEGQPRGIAFDGERLWVSATTGGYLAVFDPDAPGQVERVPGIDGPREVRFGLGAIWVTTGSNERLIAIDPDTRERIRSFAVGPLAYGLAVSDRFAWAASEKTGRLIKVAAGE